VGSNPTLSASIRFNRKTACFDSLPSCLHRHSALSCTSSRLYGQGYSLATSEPEHGLWSCARATALSDSPGRLLHNARSG
jgi:hypothetical protein